MRTSAIIIAILASISAMAQEKDDVQVSPSTAARCKAEGGCVLVSRKVMNELLQDAYTRGAQDAVKQLEGLTCKKAVWI